MSIFIFHVGPEGDAIQTNFQYSPHPPHFYAEGLAVNYSMFPFYFTILQKRSSFSPPFPDNNNSFDDTLIRSICFAPALSGFVIFFFGIGLYGEIERMWSSINYFATALIAAMQKTRGQIIFKFPFETTASCEKSHVCRIT